MVLVGHVPDAVRGSEAVAAGQKSIEHLTGVLKVALSRRSVPQRPKGPALSPDV